MFHSILVPLDGSTLAEQAVAPAAAVAQRHAAALYLAIVHPWGPPEDAPFAGTKPDRDCRETEGVYLNQLMLAVGSAYRITTCETILDGAAGPALAEFARQRQVDLVVASTHGRGALGRFVLGSVVHYLMHALRASLLLIKPQHAPAPTPSEGFTRILVATDGSAEAAAALDPAAALAATSSTITLFHAMRPVARGGQALEAHRIDAESQLTALVPRLTARGIGVDTAVAVAVNPAGAILAQAERSSADLIVLTTRKRSATERALFGSVADTVVHHATVPVLVCHAGG